MNFITSAGSSSFLWLPLACSCWASLLSLTQRTLLKKFPWQSLNLKLSHNLRHFRGEKEILDRPARKLSHYPLKNECSLYVKQKSTEEQKRNPTLTQVPVCHQYCDCREPVKVLSTKIRNWVSPASFKYLNTMSQFLPKPNNFLQRAANIELFWVKPLLFLWITFLLQAQEQENYSFEKARPHLISGHQDLQV